MNPIFVYKKEDTIKCLNLEEAQEQSYQLSADNWEHVSTLDPCVYIEYLHNTEKLINIQKQ